MKTAETRQTTQINTTYDPFSQQPEYIETNRAFIEHFPLDNVTRVLDLACGTGTLTELLLETRSNCVLIGSDISSESLNIARDLFRRKQLLVNSQNDLEHAIIQGKEAVFFLESSADDLSYIESGTIDLIMMGNSIHMLLDKDKLLAEAHRVLRPGGSFAFNSAFFVGTYPEGTESVYTEWIREALAFITEIDTVLKRHGQPGIPRERGKRAKAFNKGWLSQMQWAELLQRHGFRIQHEHQRTMIWTQQSFETIGAYTGFAELMMSGYPSELASKALVEGARRAFANLGITSVPRLWLEMIGVKQ